MGEFDLIARYFTRPVRPGGAAALGVGDDCALLAPAPGMQLAISSDMLVEGRHFFADVDPEALGHKALAVNLSDLAACGARPLAFTLALSLPGVREPWLAGFSRGLLALADAHGCELVGGDTTQGPLNICITVFGEVPPGRALLRSGAQPGEDLYVSGTLGDARLALEALLGHITLPPDLLARAAPAAGAPHPARGPGAGAARRGQQCHGRERRAAG
jgi:thiamine-monophosphate kinase